MKNFILLKQSFLDYILSFINSAIRYADMKIIIKETKIDIRKGIGSL
jgi:hypothetical protein